MSKPTNNAKPQRRTLRSLPDEMQLLLERVADLEDLRELNAAIKRNGNKPGIPWAQAKKELGLDDL